jgi:hypothetical protein
MNTIDIIIKALKEVAKDNACYEVTAKDVVADALYDIAYVLEREQRLEDQTSKLSTGFIDPNA